MVEYDTGDDKDFMSIINVGMTYSPKKEKNISMAQVAKTKPTTIKEFLATPDLTVPNVYTKKTDNGQIVTFRGLQTKDVSIFHKSGSDAVPYMAAKVSVDQYPKHNEIPADELQAFIGRLLRDGHMVPFEHCNITFRLNIPKFVMVQLARYRTATISERSLRYTKTPHEFYIPPIIYKNERMRQSYESWICDAVDLYEEYLKQGCSKAEARNIIPVSVVTTALYTINLRNLFHLLDQRLDSHAQKETRFVAWLMNTHAHAPFPITMQCNDQLKGYETN